jgi:dTDP-4-amino-4,6-dideoxy-D-galactose acyltransferase
VSHTDSRFYNDGGFERERCDELYATWIENSCTGYADTVFVSDLGKGAVAYLSCHLKTKDQGNIGLFAVDSSHQGMGIGRRLIKRAISWFREQGVTTIDVVTQGRNFQAQSIYQKCGFMTKSMELWFHYSPQPGIAYR